MRAPLLLLAILPIGCSEYELNPLLPHTVDPVSGAPTSVARG